MSALTAEQQRVVEREAELKQLGWLRRTIQRLRCDHDFTILHEDGHAVAAAYCFKCGKWWRPGFWGP